MTYSINPLKMQRSSQYDWVDVKILNLSEMLIEQSFNTVQHNLLLLGFQPLTAWAPMADPKLGECTRWSTPTARYIIVRYNFLETFQKSFWFLLFDSNQIQLWMFVLQTHQNSSNLVFILQVPSVLSVCSWPSLPPAYKP